MTVPVPMPLPCRGTIPVDAERDRRDQRAVIGSGEMRAVPERTADNAEAPAAIIGAARAGVLKVNPELPESASWVMAAEALHAANWPGLAARALAAAEKVSPSAARAPGVRRLAAEPVSLSVRLRVLVGTDADVRPRRWRSHGLLLVAAGPEPRRARVACSRRRRFGSSVRACRETRRSRVIRGAQRREEAAGTFDAMRSRGAARHCGHQAVGHDPRHRRQPLGRAAVLAD